MAKKRVRLDEQGLPIRREDAGALAPDSSPVEPGEPSDCDCPHLDPEDWNEVENDWSDIQFLRASTTALLGVPVGFGGIKAELRKKAEAIGATVPEDAMLLLGAGKFRRPVMLEIEGAPPGARGVHRPGGTAFTRIVPTAWGDMGKRADETRDMARRRFDRKPNNLWIGYLTCRECSAERDYETLFVAHVKDR